MHPNAHPVLSRRTLLGGGFAVGSTAVLGGWQVAPASAVTQPTVAGCTTWGAQAARGAIQVLQQRPTMVVVHHTASANSTDLSVSHAYALSRSIQQWHFDRGWVDSGQQFTNSRGGHVTEGRHGSLSALQGGRTHVVGAHVSGQNSVALGIENEGTYTSVRPPQAQYDALVGLVAYMCQQYAIPTGSIYGHRDFNATECPGEMLYAMLPQLRTDVAARLSGSQPPPARVWPTLRSGSTGEQVRTAQLLLNATGARLTADRAFGPATETATKQFQTARGLTADGVIGTRTWEVLAPRLAAGAKGPAVEAVQRQLNLRGAGLAVDGVFGSGTTSAVRSFQSSHGLTVDGVVGLDTWSRLLVADSTVRDRTWAPRTIMR
jgi:peptidoglycan hydrolase-like protein with peptidoglycan-binding domain